jgi:hypothetical protein
LADYVVPAEDLYPIPVDKVKEVKIIRTVVGGKASMKHNSISADMDLIDWWLGPEYAQPGNCRRRL